MSAAAANLAMRIDALLPQTQCTRCSYAGCLPYAEAIARGDAPINQCPPGGEHTIHALSALLNTPVLPLNPANGIAAPPRVAFIDETRCIGCARCLDPCPVDAIVGSGRMMHTVMIDRCTGCELCLPPCPVDCIEMRPGTPAEIAPALNRLRFNAHIARLERRQVVRERQLAAKKAGAASSQREPR